MKNANRFLKIFDCRSLVRLDDWFFGAANTGSDRQVIRLSVSIQILGNCILLNVNHKNTQKQKSFTSPYLDKPDNKPFHQISIYCPNNILRLQLQSSFCTLHKNIRIPLFFLE